MNKNRGDPEDNPLLDDRNDAAITPNIGPAIKILRDSDHEPPEEPKDEPEADFSEPEEVDQSQDTLNEAKNWVDFAKYKLETIEAEERGLEDIFEINKIIKYFYNQVVVKKIRFRDINSLEHFELLQNHYVALKQGKFSWDKEFDNLENVHSLMKDNHTKYSHPFDSEYINTSLFQILFPVDLIDMYLHLVVREYGTPVYDKALRIQTNLMEVLLWHHLKSDTRFHLTLATANLNLIDPFLRIAIRQRNRADKNLTAKYFNSKFDLKNFVLKMLDLYFPNVTWRYIGGGHEMHRWTLQLILNMFELGLYDYDELGGLVTVLIQKLENMIILEEKSFKDFETTLKGYPAFCKNLKKYFVQCKEIVTAICIHIVVLMNDRSLMNSYHFFNKKIDVNKFNPQAVWKDAFFNNSDISGILMRILTTYLLRTATENKENLFSPKIMQYTSDFIMIITDIENDMCYVSSKVVDGNMLEFYSKPVPRDLDEKAAVIRKNLVDLLDRLVSFSTKQGDSEVQKLICVELESLMSEISSRDVTFKYILALQGVPKVLLSILSMVTHLDTSKECEIKCLLLVGEILKDNIIGQVTTTEGPGLAHFKLLFGSRPLSALILIENIFKDNYHLFYIHRSLCEQFFRFFKTIHNNLMDTYKTTSESNKKVFREYNAETKQFLVKTVNDPEENCLEELLTYFTFCRWIAKLLDHRDSFFDAKFIEFSIQEILESSFFDLMIKVIRDKDFLPADSSGKGSIIDFQPVLLNARGKDIYDLYESKDNGLLTDTKAKGIIFEVSMMTLNLMNKACSRLYMHYIYSRKARPHLDTLLDDTEYMFGMASGLEFRTEVLELYTLFRVFPNNHLIANRLLEFKGLTVTSELAIPPWHLVTQPDKTGLADIIIKEIERVTTIAQKMGERDAMASEKDKDYFFKGLFPMIYKYLSGLIAYYVRDANMNKVKKNIDQIQSTLIEQSSVMNEFFKVKLSFPGLDAGNVTGGQSEAGGSALQGIGAMFGGGRGGAKDQKRKRRTPDQQELIFPDLYAIRNTITKICENLKEAYYQDGSESAANTIQNLEVLTNVPTALSTESRFDAGDSTKTLALFSRQVTISNEDSNSNRLNPNLASKLFGKIALRGGWNSADLRSFRILMEEYKIQKKEALLKPTHENLIIQFLESEAANVDNVISFFMLITDTFFARTLPTVDAAGKQVDISQEDKDWAPDRMMLTFLQNDVLYSFISFLDIFLNNCQKVKDALFKACQDGGKGEQFIFIMYYVMLNLGYLAIYKTFQDSDHVLISERFQTLCSFFKNLCENNYQNFKKYLGTAKPRLEMVKDYYLADKSLMFDVYRRMEAFCERFTMTTTSNKLMLGDHAENYHNVQHIIRLVSECVCGPCEANQMQIYTFRTDRYMGTIKRVVDNMNSNLYELKETVLDYFIALMEDNKTTVNYFAANITFDIIFNLIFTLLKRLYIYATVSQDSVLYAKLVKDAEARYIAKMKAKKLKEEEEISKDPGHFTVYGLDKIQKMKSGMFGEEEAEERNENGSEVDYVAFEMNDPNIITKEMEECITVENYEDIMTVYLKNKIFSEHLLMRIVQKLNGILVNFNQQVGGYNVCLNNVYHSLIQKYGEDVPIHVRKRIGGVQSNSSKDFNEKHVFYMFLTKITAEIELRNPETTEIVKTLYPLKPCTFFMTDHTKAEFMMSVPHNEMISSLISKYEIFRIEMNNNLLFYRRFPKMYSISSDGSFYYFKLILWVLGFALNVLMLIFYRRDAEPDDLIIRAGKHIIEAGHYPILILALFIVVLSVIALVVWLLARYRQKTKIVALEYKAQNEELFMFGSNKILSFLQIYIWQTLLCQAYPIVFVIHITSCVLGILINPFFLTLQLLTIVFISKTTNYVVQAITTHFDQLALTFFLATLVMYSYSVLTAESFFDSLESNSENTVNCSYLWECLMYHLNFGLRNGGGIGDVSSAVNPSQESGKYVAKFFYDVIFFILINIVSLNIIFGIIIDTFADMREELSARNSALASQCPICMVEKSEVEKEGKNFEAHINHNHNFWKYCNYMCYLEEKGREELNGFEYIIWEHYSRKSTLWVPQNIDTSDEDSKKLLEKMGELDTKLSTIMTEVQSVLAAVKSIKPVPAEEKK